MNETWEQTKERLRKQGIGTKPPVIETPEPPRPRYDEPKAEPPKPRYDLRRVILPNATAEYVVFNAVAEDIQWWLDHKHRFKAREIVSTIEGIEPLVFYEPIPSDATVAERDLYYNKRPVIIEEK